MSSFLAGAICLILLYVCYTDMRYRLIRNSVVTAIFILSLLLVYFTKDNDNVTFNLYAPLSILAIGFILSYFDLVGAGDIKLLVALTVALSAEYTFQLLILTAFAGLPIAIIAYIVHKIRRKSPVCEVPYGVAIAIGYWILMLPF